MAAVQSNIGEFVKLNSEAKEQQERLKVQVEALDVEEVMKGI